MNMQSSSIPADNGVDVASILAIRTALTETPAAAQFTWRASCEWLGGVHSRSTVETFFGAGAEQTHRQPYSVEADHPGVFAAPDNVNRHRIGTPDRLSKGTPRWVRSGTRPGAAVRVAETGRVPVR